MDPWYKATTPRPEVSQGRSFNPDEFAIALEQVVAGSAPPDYRDPEKFFARTCFTRALREHAGMVLRRLAGQTENTAPVLALITQFGGGKTHTLTALYHLVRHGKKLPDNEVLQPLLQAAGLAEAPRARVAVFVGNAWDPAAGAETPWIDLARQLAGDEGVAALGKDARDKAPGTKNLAKLLATAGGPVLILCDEVLNFLSRHRDRAESFRDFLGNLVRTLTGTTGSAAVISLPQSKPEMSDWDLRWQDIIVKEVNRVAKNLLANDETEISEVIRRRLFEDLGSVRVRKNVAKAYADWCFERRAQLPPEWTAVDTAATEAKAREFLRQRFEDCYPFHPATLSVFQRKWQALPHYQQTRGTLAMFAQWIACAQRTAYRVAGKEPLLTLGSAPLDVPAFRAAVLTQLGETRLSAAIETDIAGEHSHARALDADTSGPLRDIHRRVGTAILFESSGGQVDRVARLPELRFALGGPDMDTTSIDTHAAALESKAFFISRVGTDGYKVYHKATIRKAVSDRRASLDEEAEIKPALRSLVRKEFEAGPGYPREVFPDDPAGVPDSPRLTLILMDPCLEWTGDDLQRRQIAEWTRQRAKSPRLYPGALLWCLKKPGRDLRDKVELWQAWKRVAREVEEGTLGADYDRADRAEIRTEVAQAEEAAQEEVWAGYRYVVLADSQEKDGLREVDLGAGHASAGETLWTRVLAALKTESLLNTSFGAGYLERNWPPALKESGAWPLKSLRQSFLNGVLTRIPDVDAVLGPKIVEYVERGDFGLASGRRPDGSYDRLWFAEPVNPEEVAFEEDVFLLTKARATALKEGATKATAEPDHRLDQQPNRAVEVDPGPEIDGRNAEVERESVPRSRTLRLVGSVPPAVWNRMGTTLIPKLRSGAELQLGIDFSVTLGADLARSLEVELRQILADLGLNEKVHIQYLGPLPAGDSSATDAGS
jgi:hypothetical protein